MTLRVLAGSLKGRLFSIPKIKETRPITSLLRKSLFDSLQGQVEGARILDLFAGSGAIGIEALSRGAEWVHFVDNHPVAVRCIQSNLTTLGLEERTFVEKNDAFWVLAHYHRDPFNLIFLDPPYPFGLDGYKKILAGLLQNKHLYHEETLFFLETPTPLVVSLHPFLQDTFRIVKEKKSSTTTLYTLSLNHQG